MSRAPAILLLIFVPLVACGPVSPEVVARQCEDRARAAQGPKAAVAVGVGTGGTSASVGVGVSLDYLRGRDPQEVYETCVRERTGQPPIRPLVL